MKLNINICSFLILLFFLFSINLFSQICDIIPPRGFGGEYEQGMVMYGWENSGAFYTTYGGLYIDEWVDVTKSGYGIEPGENYVGHQIQQLIDDYIGTTEHILLYFPPGQYLINSNLTMRPNVILKGAGGDYQDPNKTVFANIFRDGTFISFPSNAVNCGIEDIYITEALILADKKNEKFKGDELRDFHANTIDISYGANNCWIRGVESYYTRRFHLNIVGNNNTISGCYFHQAWDYGGGGNAYGVVLNGDPSNQFGSYRNRVEDNIFQDLRHAIVFQKHPQQNVIGYNYSRDSYGTKTVWGITVEIRVADLLFHGRESENIAGPCWNLCEGNIVEWIRFDEYHDENGPYNTIMRCKAGIPSEDDGIRIDKKNSFENQYKQNIVGTDAIPADNDTQSNIESYGYERWWMPDENGNNDWEDIPIDSCSYYLTNEPSFWDKQVNWIQWPFRADGIIPSKYRYDRNHDCYPLDPPTTEVVFAGWDIYSNMYGPPNYYFENITLNDESMSYVAMDEIETNNTFLLNSNNSISFIAGEKVILKPGFKVTNLNNYFYAKAEDFSENKNSNIYIKDTAVLLIPINTIRANENKQFSSKYGLDDKTCPKNEIVIGPNPNNGIFSVFLPVNLQVSNIEIINIEGEIIYQCLPKSSKIAINISDKSKGLYLVRLLTRTNSYEYKILYQ